MTQLKPTTKIAGLTLLCLVLLGLGLVRGRARAPLIPATPSSPQRIGPEVGAAARDVERSGCEQKLAAVLDEPGLPGAPALEKNRIELLFHAKAEPDMFVTEPEYGPEAVSPLVKSFRQLVESARWNGVDKAVKSFHGSPGVLRQILLRDGYLYADDPDLAFALVHLVTAQDLFGHDRIWIQRGDKLFHATRRGGKYYYNDGSNKGDPVQLLLFDRLGSAEPDPKPLHRDLRSLRYRLHFSRMQIRHVTETHLVADLQYGDAWVPSVLKTDGARVDLECEVVDPSVLPQVTATRELEARRQRVAQVLRESMQAEIADGLPFDEPRHEYGVQLDGNLRHNWRAAYFGKRPKFNFNGDRYDVFTRQGHPLVPQVCVDFVTDTIERASGTWYRDKGEKPGKTAGAFDFGTELDKAWLRRAPEFLAYVSTREDWFEVHKPSARERVKVGDRDGLMKLLTTHAADYQPGDVVMIKGRTPWDRHHIHYHSFFIYDTDPISGMPFAIVGNAGKPSIRSWEIEARRTPERTIEARLRPNLEWLEHIFQARLDQVSADPFSLSPSGFAD